MSNNFINSVNFFLLNEKKTTFDIINNSYIVNKLNKNIDSYIELHYISLYIYCNKLITISELNNLKIFIMYLSAIYLLINCNNDEIIYISVKYLQNKLKKIYLQNNNKKINFLLDIFDSIINNEINIENLNDIFKKNNYNDDSIKSIIVKTRENKDINNNYKLINAIIIDIINNIIFASKNNLDIFYSEYKYFNENQN